MAYSSYSRVTNLSPTTFTFAATRTTLAKPHTDVLTASTAVKLLKTGALQRKRLGGLCFGGVGVVVEIS